MDWTTLILSNTILGLSSLSQSNISYPIIALFLIFFLLQISVNQIQIFKTSNYLFVFFLLILLLLLLHTLKLFLQILFSVTENNWKLWMHLVGVSNLQSADSIRANVLGFLPENFQISSWFFWISPWKLLGERTIENLGCTKLAAPICNRPPLSEQMCSDFSWISSWVFWISSWIFLDFFLIFLGFFPDFFYYFFLKTFKWENNWKL